MKGFKMIVALAMIVGITAFSAANKASPPIVEAYGYECPDVPSQDSVGYPYLPSSQALVIKECYYPSGAVTVYPIRPAIRRETTIDQTSIVAYPGEVVKISESGQASGVPSNNCYFARITQPTQVSDYGGIYGNNKSIINPEAWEIPFGNYCPGAPGSPPYTSRPTQQSPPPPQPSPCYNSCAPTGSPPASDRFTYKDDGVNVPGGTTYVSAAANEMVVFTTGPLTYANWSFYGQRDGQRRGTILVLVGPLYNEPVYMQYGGWKGTYVARYNVYDAWRPLLDQKIWDMRHYGNCSDPYNGCQFLDNLVVERLPVPGFYYQIWLDNPLRTY